MTLADGSAGAEWLVSLRSPPAFALLSTQGAGGSRRLASPEGPWTGGAPMNEGGSAAALRAVIERFFASHPRPHCAECLAHVIGWPVGQVTMAFRGFSPWTSTRTVLEECSRCHQIRIVLTRRQDVSGGETLR